MFGPNSRKSLRVRDLSHFHPPAVTAASPSREILIPWMYGTRNDSFPECFCQRSMIWDESRDPKMAIRHVGLSVMFASRTRSRSHQYLCLAGIFTSLHTQPSLVLMHPRRFHDHQNRQSYFQYPRTKAILGCPCD